jgi:hypothetical protein
MTLFYRLLCGRMPQADCAVTAPGAQSARDFSAAGPEAFCRLVGPKRAFVLR